MKLKLSLLFCVFAGFISCFNSENREKVLEIDSLARVNLSNTTTANKKTVKTDDFTFTAYFDETGKPAMIVRSGTALESEYHLKNGELVLIINNMKNGTHMQHSRYYFSVEKLILCKKDDKEQTINKELEREVQNEKLIYLESEKTVMLAEVGADIESDAVSLEFLKNFDGKSAADLFENSSLENLLGSVVTNPDDLSNLKAQISYGDLVSVEGDIVCIPGQLRTVIDEQGTQITLFSQTIIDTKTNKVCVGMSDENGNPTIFYTNITDGNFPEAITKFFGSRWEKIIK